MIAVLPECDVLGEKQELGVGVGDEVDVVVAGPSALLIELLRDLSFCQSKTRYYNKISAPLT